MDRSSSADSESDGDLFADCLLSDSDSYSDDCFPDPRDPILPTSSQVAEMVMDPQQFALARHLAGISYAEARSFTLGRQVWPVQEPGFYDVQHQTLNRVYAHEMRTGIKCCPLFARASQCA
jgi:hypothetical protein